MKFNTVLHDISSLKPYPVTLNWKGSTKMLNKISTELQLDAKLSFYAKYLYKGAICN